MLVFEDLDLLFGIIGALVATFIAYLARAKNGYLRYNEKLAKHESVPLGLYEIPASWITSGSPVFRSNVFAAAHDKSSASGLWECTGPGAFEWHYGRDESIYVLEGFAEVEYLGRKFTLRPGDCTHFAAGTTSRWVVTERIKKSYTLYDPGWVVRKMRRVLGMLGMNKLSRA